MQQLLLGGGRVAIWASTILLCLFAIGTSYAQVFTGGSVSIGFDNRTTYADVAPVLGYEWNRWRTGVSPVFNYSKTTDLPARYSYGARLFSQYTVFHGFFLHGEFEALNVERIRPGTDAPSNRVWIVSLPLGAGYQQELSDHVRIQFMVLWNVIENEHTPATNPIIRGGVQYRF